MIRESISRLLADTRVTQFIQECRNVGRRHIASDARKAFSASHAEFKALLESSVRLTEQEFVTLRFAKDFCEAEQFLAEGRSPRYPVYTNLPLIDAFIGARSRWPLAKTFTRCRSAIALLVLDWREFERMSFEAETRGAATRKGFDQRRASERISELWEFYRGLQSDPLPHIPPLDEVSGGLSGDWEHLACRDEGAVGFVHATCLPQSTWHDEYLFIRTLHIMEVCFWAILSGLRGASQFAQRGDWPRAASCLKEGNTFAALLLPLFQIFKTMPVENFKDGFRDETGDSSAIQSNKFQTIDLLARGYGEPKREALRQVGDYDLLTRWKPREVDTLKGVHDLARLAPEEHRLDIRAECEALDRHLRAWRGDHLGIVQTYLGITVAGTGGEGFDYLQKTFKDPPGLIGLSVKAEPALSEVLDPRQESDWLAKRTKDIGGQNTDIAFIRAAGVSKQRFVPFVEAAKPKLIAELRQRSDEIDERFREYEPLFARFGYTSPLPGLKKKLLKVGFGEEAAPSFIAALQMATGVLMGLHRFGALALPVRIGHAADGTPFQPSTERKRLKEGELYFADSKSIFSTYLAGPDKRTEVPDPTRKPEDDDMGELLCIVMGAPEMPNDVFTAAVRRAQEWLDQVSESTSYRTVRVTI